MRAKPNSTARLSPCCALSSVRHLQQRGVDRGHGDQPVVGQALPLRGCGKPHLAAAALARVVAPQQRRELQPALVGADAQRLPRRRGWAPRGRPRAGRHPRRAVELPVRARRRGADSAGRQQRVGRPRFGVPRRRLRPRPRLLRLGRGLRVISVAAAAALILGAPQPRVPRLRRDDVQPARGRGAERPRRADARPQRRARAVLLFRCCRPHAVAAAHRDQRRDDGLTPGQLLLGSDGRHPERSRLSTSYATSFEIHSETVSVTAPCRVQ